MTTEHDYILDERLEWLGVNHANQSGKSDKFYAVTLHQDSGGDYIETRRWGRYGTKGQSKVLRHLFKFDAVRSASNILIKKRSAGYTRPVAALKRLAHLMDED